MSDEKPTAKDEFKMLGRGILRTFLRDMAAMAVGGIVGAIVGVIGAFMLALPPRLGFYIGGLAGIAIGLMARSTFSALFDYDRPPRR